jgi:putative phosphoesterase
MKVGILADSHDNMPMVARAVELFNKEKVELVLHAGDFISPITANEFAKLKAPLIGIFGNNDGDKLYLTEQFCNIGKLYPDFHEFTVGGKHGVLMHEPKFIDALIKSRHYDLVVYGHTHNIDIREGKPLIINPGECGGWLTGRATVVILDTETMQPRLIDL